MQKDRHPHYVETTLSCACGATFHTRSTMPEQRISVCSQCHPYCTGRQKAMDTTGRIAAFRRKYGEVSRSTR
jgi:large subunit ribosomal protein L31